MRDHRWPALAVIACLVGFAVLYDHENPNQAEGGSAPQVLALERAVTHISDSPQEVDRWFCLGAGPTLGGSVEVDLLLTNTAAGQVMASVTPLEGTVHVSEDSLDSEGRAGALETSADAGVTATDVTAAAATGSAGTGLDGTTTTGRGAVYPEPVSIPVAAGTTEILPLGRDPLPGALAAVIESDSAGLVVETRVSSEVGVSVSGCATTTSTEWYFASGATTRDSRYEIVAMNPFPDDAVLDVRVLTEDGTRVPTGLQGLVVPRRSAIAIDIGEEAQRREHIAVSVAARSGRTVVGRTQLVDGTLGPKGVQSGLGATGPWDTWVFPVGTGGQGPPPVFAVMNMSERAAEVDVEIRPDDPERLFDVEPFALTLDPDRYATVDLGAESERIPDDTTFGAMVLVRNTVPVVAEQWAVGETLVSIVPGIAIQATRWTVPAVPDAGTGLGIVNVSAESIALVTVSEWTVQGWSPVDDLADLEIGPGRRLLIRPDDLPPRSLRVDASAPVVVGRHLDLSGGSAFVAALPARGTSSVPDPFGLSE